jgi:hypothetical protein
MTKSQGGIEGTCGRQLSVQSLVSVWERWLQEEDDEGERKFV